MDHPLVHECGGNPHAVQTLREFELLPAFAEILNCACFSTAFIRLHINPRAV
jgi:hypothetical protein